MLESYYYKPDNHNITPNLYLKSSCHSSMCADLNSYCDLDGFCKCNPGYEFFDDNLTCVRCPGYDSLCNGCCANTKPELICKNYFCKCVDANNCYGTQSNVIATASQIALTAALVMGIAALAMVIYRLCTKPKYETARQRAERRMRDERASLSSMQIRILARLRDRPPPYQGEQPQTILSPVQNLENPPSYNCSRDIENHLPPPYTEIVLNPSEYINQSYENTEQQSSNSINVNIENVNKSARKDDTTSRENIDNNNNNNNNK